MSAFIWPHPAVSPLRSLQRPHVGGRPLAPVRRCCGRRDNRAQVRLLQEARAPPTATHAPEKRCLNLWGLEILATPRSNVHAFCWSAGPRLSFTVSESGSCFCFQRGRERRLREEAALSSTRCAASGGPMGAPAVGGGAPWSGSSRQAGRERPGEGRPGASRLQTWPRFGPCSRPVSRATPCGPERRRGGAVLALGGSLGCPAWGPRHATQPSSFSCQRGDKLERRAGLRATRSRWTSSFCGRLTANFATLNLEKQE